MGGTSYPRSPVGGAPISTQHTKPYREITLSALVFAVIVGVILNAAITYSGLKIGFTIVGSAIAAVLGFGVLRGVVRLFVPGAGSVLETNIAQTVASSVNTSNSGVIFTVPVLFLLGITLTWSDLDFWLIVLACIGGAILGCAFIIPLRKQMIDIERLRFPSAVGVASILRSPGGGIKKTLVLVAGVLLGALIYLPAGLPDLTEPVPLDDIREPALVDGERSEPRQVALAQLINDDAQDNRDNWDRLDELVFNERLSADDAQVSRELATYVRAQAAPAALAERGAWVARLAELTREKKTLTDRITKGNLEPRGDEDLGTDPEAALRERLVSVEAEYERVNGYLAFEPDGSLASVDLSADDAPSAEQLLAMAEFTRLPDTAAERVYRITTDTLEDPPSAGESPWLSLIDKPAGWAGEPSLLGFRTFGYADLDWRAPKHYQPQSAELIEDLDRDQNGRPDYILSDSSFDLGRVLGLPGEYQLVFAIAPFALGAGFITGRAGLMVLAGGILAYFVINPVVFSMGWLPETLKPHEAPDAAFSLFNRPLGIGLLLGGAAAGIIASFPSILAALKSVARSGAVGKGGVKRKKDELGLFPLIIAIIGGIALLFLAADFVGNKPLNQSGDCPVSGDPVSGVVAPTEYSGYAISFASDDDRTTWETEWTDDQRDGYMATQNAKPGWLADLDPHVRAAIIAVIGALWIWFAGIIIAQCTGMTDWSPISGMALLTVVLVLLMAGPARSSAPSSSAPPCASRSRCAADMMADLKTGYLVGSKPKRAADRRAALHGHRTHHHHAGRARHRRGRTRAKFGIAIGPGTDTSAPQAQALQASSPACRAATMPYALYGAWAPSRCGLLGLGSFSGLGVLVGLSMYLPFAFIATYGVGCVINMLT
jgi:hypothetical protein